MEERKNQLVDELAEKKEKERENVMKVQELNEKICELN